MTPKLRCAIRELTGRRDRGTKVWQSLLRRQRHLNALAYRKTRRAVEQRKAAERSPADVLTTVVAEQPGWHPYRVMALQLRDELEKLVRFLEEKDPETILEIGTLQGGTLYVWARALGSTRRIVSVDKPFWNRLTLRRRSELYPTFSDATRIDVIYGNSHAESTYDEVVKLVGDDVDLLFVDGDHTYEGVARDFEMYRQLVGDGGLVAFHDIKRHAKDREEKVARLGQADDLREKHVTVGEPEWGVSTFWKDIRDEYDTREFLTHPKQMGAGIGVVEF